MKVYRADTPLAATTEPVSVSSDKKEENNNVKVTDVGSVLSDIAKRAAARKAAKDASNKKLRDDITERRNSEKKQTGAGKLIGLRGFGDYGK